MSEPFPAPVLTLYDRPMWASITARRMKLQCCAACGDFFYPPGPSCPNCLSLDYEWREISGNAEILSRVIFHRQYLPAYPAPYNVIAVKLAEGPIMISNLEGEPPSGSWIGAPVRITYVEDGHGAVLPRFVLATD